MKEYVRCNVHHTPKLAVKYRREAIVVAEVMKMALSVSFSKAERAPLQLAHLYPSIAS
jgi:hypothetical protein